MLIKHYSHQGGVQVHSGDFIKLQSHISQTSTTSDIGVLYHIIILFMSTVTLTLCLTIIYVDTLIGISNSNFCIYTVRKINPIETAVQIF